MKILFIGDIYGEPGRRILQENIELLKTKYKPNIIIANAENSAHGRGITHNIYKEFMSMGIHLLTMGNHTYGNRQILELFEDENINIIRPINYSNVSGNGYKIINFNGKKLLVINALGRTFFNLSLENPFTQVKQILETVPHDYSVVDFHAEATSEKVALGHHLDGLASAIVGTHTHIPTADERILPKGTLYITDVGMTGPLNGVIGVDKDLIIERFINGISGMNVVADGPTWLNAVLLNLDEKLPSIKRIQIYEE
ncbi:MAG: TIGR00282 family metallophosphoesterase [Acholeplasmataceae bacterium]|jgi:metallophosphoesterase (TIGR00282 family)